MITGDHPKTALAIAGELGIHRFQEEMLTGREIEDLGDPETSHFHDYPEKIRVFARVKHRFRRCRLVDALVRKRAFCCSYRGRCQ
jgi:magnesium-transporting ATPase (P-type)